jgi:beta-galactosidase
MWIGKGPFPGYPDKYLLNDFGIYTLKNGDLNFNGNRSGVELVVVTDACGNGLAIIADNDDISFEVMDGRIIISHNDMLMGLGNKKSRAVMRLNANSIGEIKGEMKILPLHRGQWPDKLIEVFGLPDPSIRPFQPFSHSYDLTW